MNYYSLKDAAIDILIEYRYTKLKIMQRLKNVLVEWPFSQIFFDHPRFNECYLLAALDDQDVLDSAYFIPEDLYEELRNEVEGKIIISQT